MNSAQCIKHSCDSHRKHPVKNAAIAATDFWPKKNGTAVDDGTLQAISKSKWAHSDALNNRDTNQLLRASLSGDGTETIQGPGV